MTALPDLYRTASRASLVDLGRAARVLETPLLERAIGVIYRPQTEQASHCFAARLDEQFDVVIHLDRTSALQPLDDIAEWDPLEPRRPTDRNLIPLQGRRGPPALVRRPTSPRPDVVRPPSELS